MPEVPGTCEVLLECTVDGGRVVGGFRCTPVGNLTVFGMRGRSPDTP